MPRPFRRIAVRLFNRTLEQVPHSTKYGVGLRLRRDRYPYRIIRDGDVVVQVGAPFDTLKAGRSRAMYFAQLVGTGRVLIIEADPINLAALRDYTARHGLGDRVSIAPCGAWSHPTRLSLYSNPRHPATNAVVEADQAHRETDLEFNCIEITVDTVDALCERAGLGVPRLLSVTTNGAEMQILAGAKRCLDAGTEYVSLAPASVTVSDVEGLGYRLIAHDDRGYFFRRAGDTEPTIVPGTLPWSQSTNDDRPAGRM